MFYFSSKRHVACLFCVLFSLYSVFGQADTAVNAPIDETDIVLGAQDTAETANPGSSGSNRSSSSWMLLRIVLVLALICAGAYGALYLVKKSGKPGTYSDPFLKNPSGLQLGPNKSVQVITIGGKAFLIGVTDQAVNLIAELNDQELVDSLHLSSDKTAGAPGRPFSAILSSLFPSGSSRTGQSTGSLVSDASQDLSKDFSASAQATADFLRKQRERIQNAGLQEGEGEDRL